MSNTSVLSGFPGVAANLLRSLKRISRVVAVVALSAFASSAYAQAYPSKPVKIIISGPAGGIADMLGRLAADRLQKSLGQTFVVDNISGAGGVIAVSDLVKSSPDGYTLLLSHGGPVATSLTLYKKLPYEAARDLAPIAMVGDVQMILVGNPTMKQKDLKELIAFAKDNPKKLNAGNSGIGSLSHLLMEQFDREAKVDVNIVPFRGDADLKNNIISGTVDVGIAPIGSVSELVKGGRLRALAVALPARSEILPDVPTFRELGLSEMVGTSWFALLARAGTPKDIIDRLNQETIKIFQSPEAKELLASRGVYPRAKSESPQEASAFIRQDAVKWAKVIKDAKIELP